jgi:hypothetical protein
MRKFLKGWKTLVFNALAMAPMVIDIGMQLFISPEFRGLIPAGWEEEYLIAVTLINIYLRSITDSPVGRKW